MKNQFIYFVNKLSGKLGIFLTFISLIVLSSCGSQPENVKLIPSNSLGVIKINIKSLVAKAEPRKLVETDIMKEIIKNLKNSGKKNQRAFVDQFVKNPLTLGIDFLEPMYGFLNGSGTNDYNYACLTMELTNPNSFEEMIKTLGIGEVQESDGLKYVDVKKDFAVGWKNSVACLITNFHNLEKDNLEVLSGIFAIKSDDAFVNDENFSDFLNTDSDIGYYANWSSAIIFYKSLFEMMAAFGSQNAEALDFVKSLADYKDNFSALQLTFEDNKIGLLMKNYLNDKIHDKFAFTKTQGISDSFTQTVTDGELIGVSAINLNVPKCIDFIKGLPGIGGMENMFEDMKQETGMDMTTSFTGNVMLSVVGVKSIEKTITGNESIDMQEAMKNYKGDWNDFDQYVEKLQADAPPRVEKVSVPVGVMTVGINNKEKIKTLLDKQLKSENGYYIAKDGLYLCLLNDKILWTSSSEYAKRFASGNLFKSYKNAVITAMLKQYPLAAYYNLDLTAYDEETVALLKNELGNKDFTLLQMLGTDLMDFRFYGDFFRANLDLNFKPGEGNTLFRIFNQTTNALQ